MSQQQAPAEFEKVITDFVHDIKTTFPEYIVFVNKWWKHGFAFDGMENEAERKAAQDKAQKNSIQFLFKFCLKKFPPRFFDILYQNNDMFAEDSEVDTEFLPQIHFRNLWECDNISDKTRQTIWKYLQLIMFSIVNCVDNKEAFGDSTSEMFESMNTDEFRGKLEETMNDIQKIFEENTHDNNNNNASERSQPNIPNAEDIYSHVSGMLGGKLGQLAKEIAEETADSFNLDMDNVSDMKDVMSSLMKNPAKMMGLVKNVGSKLDDKIKSGEIKESELMAEASEMIQKMKDIPGMGNIQDILGKMGLGGRNSKVNMNAMQEQLNRNMKAAQTRERMRDNVNKKQQQQPAAPAPAPAPALSDEALIQMMSNSNSNSNSSSNSTTSTNKKKDKKKAKKNK